MAALLSGCGATPASPRPAQRVMTPPVVAAAPSSSRASSPVPDELLASVPPDATLVLRLDVALLRQSPLLAKLEEERPLTSLFSQLSLLSTKCGTKLLETLREVWIVQHGESSDWLFLARVEPAGSVALRCAAVLESVPIEQTSLPGYEAVRAGPRIWASRGTLLVGGSEASVARVLAQQADPKSVPLVAELDRSPDTVLALTRRREVRTVNGSLSVQGQTLRGRLLLGTDSEDLAAKLVRFGLPAFPPKPAELGLLEAFVAMFSLPARLSAEGRQVNAAFELDLELESPFKLSDAAWTLLNRAREAPLRREADINLATLESSVRTHLTKGRGNAAQRFPRAAPLTPAAVFLDGPYYPDASTFADPTWKALGFAPTSASHLSYAWEVAPDGRCGIARARGRFDADRVENLAVLLRMEAAGAVTSQATKDPFSDEEASGEGAPRCTKAPDKAARAAAATTALIVDSGGLRLRIEVPSGMELDQERGAGGGSDIRFFRGENGSGSFFVHPLESATGSFAEQVSGLCGERACRPLPGGGVLRRSPQALQTEVFLPAGKQVLRCAGDIRSLTAKPPAGGAAPPALVRLEKICQSIRVAPAQVSGAGIVERGVFRVPEVSVKQTGERSATGPLSTVGVSYPELERSGTAIPAVVGRHFGLGVLLAGVPDLGTVTVKTRVTHPPITNEQTGQTATVDEWEWPVQIGVVRFTGWRFDRAGAMPPGKWTIQVLRDGAPLLEQEFEVTTPAP